MAIFTIETQDTFVSDSDVMSAKLDSPIRKEGIVNVLRSAVLLKRLLVMVIAWYKYLKNNWNNRVYKSFYLIYFLKIINSVINFWFS